LAGLRIVVTRAADQSDELCTRLEAAGAEALRCPTIRVAQPASYDALDEALSGIAQYRWVVFTSSNGARSVLSRMAQLGLPTSQLSGERVAAVGTSTARTLAAAGVQAGFVPRVERSRSLAESLPHVEGAHILLARADIADPAVSEVLRGRGCQRVDDVVAYRTLLLPPAGRALEELRGGVDGITFTSPSTVRGFLALGAEWRALLEGVVVASLGPATTGAARARGMEIDVEARERSMNGLVDALCEAFTSLGVEEDVQ
jgi:uroporphyrinogen-III synthase